MNQFVKSLKLTKIALFVSGIPINEIENNTLKRVLEYMYYFNLFWLYTDIFGEMYWIIYGIIMGKSFLELSLTAPCITISFLGTIKSIFLFLNKDIMLEVLRKLRSIHPYENTSNQLNAVESKIVKDSLRVLTFVILLLYYVSWLVIVAFILMPVISMGYDYYTTGVTEYKYPYLVKYFFDPFTKKRWPFVYFHQTWSTVIVAMNLFGADTLFYALCAYTEMHFRLLCHKFENMVAKTESETKRNLGSCVKRHQELIHLVDQVEVLYSKSTLFNMVTSSVLICLSGFNITTVSEVSVIITFGTFLSMNLSQISLLCFFGDMLMKSSSAVSLSIYNSLWYNTNQSTKKSVLLVLMRAQKPCKLTAAKFADLNLSAFTTILSRSWSYFALLKTMYN